MTTPMPPPTPEGAAKAIDEQCEGIRRMLQRKNKRYGNAALEGRGVFSRNLSPSDGIRRRIDDKLKRIETGISAADEDTIRDLIGYLILLRIVEGMPAFDAEDLPITDTLTKAIYGDDYGTGRSE